MSHDQCSPTPLTVTVEILDSIEPEMNAVRLGPADQFAPETGWARCADVIGATSYLRSWESGAADHLMTLFPCARRSAEITAAACVLDWYAYAPGFLAGAMFHIARRVPRVGPGGLAFRRHRDEHWISGVALLDDRFWCLPDDPAARLPAATVVGDDSALAEVARRQVRAHADSFLAEYRPGVRLARRTRMGAFFDSLDSGPWISDGLPARSSCLASSALLLPGGTAQFADASRMCTVVDTRGRSHLSRRRISCCESHRIEESCFDCPRTTDRRRAELAAAWPNPA